VATQSSLLNIVEVDSSKVAWQQCMWRNYCARECGRTNIYTNRHGKRKVILGPAGRALHTRPAGKNVHVVYSQWLKYSAVKQLRVFFCNAVKWWSSRNNGHTFL